MADIKIVDETTGEEKIEEAPKEHISQNNISAPVTEELQKDAIYRVMGLEKYDDQHRYKNDVDLLLRWVKETTPNASREDIKYYLRELEVKLGSPPLTERKVSFLARYAYLDMEQKRLEKEKKALQNQPKFDKRGL